MVEFTLNIFFNFQSRIIIEELLFGLVITTHILFSDSVEIISEPE